MATPRISSISYYPTQVLLPFWRLCCVPLKQYSCMYLVPLLSNPTNKKPSSLFMRLSPGPCAQFRGDVSRHKYDASRTSTSRPTKSYLTEIACISSSRIERSQDQIIRLDRLICVIRKLVPRFFVFTL